MPIDVDRIDYAQLAATIERLVAAFNDLPPIDIGRMKATKEDRAMLDQREKQLSQLWEDSEGELPQGWDIAVVNVVRSGLFQAGSACHDAKYRLRGEGPHDLSRSADTYARVTRELQMAVYTARDLRDRGPSLSHAERLLTMTGSARDALAELAKDVREILAAVGQEGIDLDEETRAGVVTAASLLDGAADSLKRRR